MKLIFDLDGVLVRSEHIWRRAYPDAYFAIFGEPSPSPDMDALQGCHYFEVAAAFIREASASGRKAKVELLPSFADKVIEVLISRLKVDAVPISGSVLVVRDLVDQGIVPALASSSPRPVIDAELKLLGLSDCFDPVVSGDDILRPKPDPEIYVKTGSLLAVPAAECVVVEDSPVGVVAALEAGMKCVMITSAGSPDLAWSDVRRCSAVVSDLRYVDWQALRMCRGQRGSR